MKAITKYSLTLLVFSLCLFVSGSASYAQVWNREVVDSTGINMGTYCSLGIDHNDVPHIVYMDADYYDLKYAVKSNNKWIVTTLDSLRYTGVSSDIAIDSKNQPHICFQEGCLLSAPCPDAGLKYMTKTAEGWIKETVDEYFVITGSTDQSYCSIQINTDDEPVIAYYKIGEDAVKLAFKLGEEWINKEYASTEIPVYLSLQLKSDDSPVIQYLCNDSLHLVVYNVGNDSWQHYSTPVVANVMLFYGGYNFDIDQNDNVHFVFPSFENVMPHFKYIYFDWQNWVKEIYGVNAPYYVKVDRENIPHILSLEGSNGLSICEKNNDSWECEDIADDLFTSYASLDFDSNNNPQFALYGNLPEASDEKSGLLAYYSFNPGSPNIDISPGEIDFEEVWTEAYAEKKIIIRNTGIADLMITNLKFTDSSPFQTNNTIETNIIHAGDSLEVVIRFTPTLTQSYSDVLEVLSNDPDHPSVNVNVTGTGISSGSTGTLLVQVNDVFADMDYLVINQENPLEGAKVEVLQNNQAMAGSVTTGEDGLAPFGNLAPGIYEIRVSKTLMLNEESTLLANHETIEIGPGINSHLMILPDSLYQYKYKLLEELNIIQEADYLLTDEYFSYKKIESKVDDQFKVWAADYDPGLTESLARLILVETMVKDLFGEGIYVSNEMFADVGNLIGYIFYMDDWGMTLLEFLKSALKTFASLIEGGGSGARELFEELVNILKEELIKRSILLSINEAVELVGSELEFPADWALMEGWQIVKEKYSSIEPNVSFGNIAWAKIINWVSHSLKDHFIQFVYIELQTSPSIQQALDYSVANTYNGSFTKAGRYEINYVSDEKNDVEEKIGWASELRETANLFMVTSIILDVAAALDPTGVMSYANQFSSALQVSAYVGVISALGISMHEFFNLPVNMGDAVDDIYFPEGTKKKTISREVSPYASSKYGTFNEENLKEQLFTAENSYDSVLLVIKDKILSGDRVDAALEIYSLRDIDNTYSSHIKQSYAPVSAVAKDANESILAFSPMYDSLISYKAMADQEKIINYLKIFCVAFDSTGQETDAVFAQIDRTIQTNHQLTSHISEMLDAVTENMAIPGVIVSSSMKQDKHSLDLGEDGTITLRIKNVGAVTTDNIRLKAQVSEALAYSGPDSIIVGSLEPGEESEEFKIIFQLASKEFKTAFWDIKIECNDAVAYSPSGTFGVVESETGSDVIKVDEEPNFYCVPNPLSSTGIIFYEMMEAGNLKIDLCDISGRKIKTLLNDYQELGTSYLPWSASSLTNGVYIIRLQNENNYSRCLKVLVNK